MFPYESDDKKCERTVKMVDLDRMERVLKGKAAQIKDKSLKKLNDLKEQVRVEAMEMKMNESDDQKKSKEILGGWMLTKDQMEFIRTEDYEYNASAGSILELLCLQRFWTWLSQFIPLSVSPCVITAAGLTINILTTVTILYFSPDARSEAPSWTFLVCAFGVFLYQTLDALDGKQSYKVQVTSIEEFYDHGCDAVSTIFVTLAVSCAGQLGRFPGLQFLLFLTSMLAFYSTHWQCHVTRQMVFGKFDVSEGQWAMIIIHLLTAFFGQKIWSNTVSIFGYEIVLCHLLALITILSMSSAVLANLGFIFGRKTPLDYYISIPRKKTNTWSPAGPLLMLTGLTVVAFWSGYFHVSPSLFVLTFGFAYAKITVKLVILNCCRGDMELLDSSLIAPLLLAANSGHLTSILHPKTALICALIFSVMEFARFFTYVSWDLRVALDLWIFSVKYAPGHPRSRRSCRGFYINGLNNELVLNTAKTETLKPFLSGVDVQTML